MDSHSVWRMEGAVCMLCGCTLQCMGSSPCTDSTILGILDVCVTAVYVCVCACVVCVYV